MSEIIGPAIGATVLAANLISAVVVVICFVRATDGKRDDTDRIINALVGIMVAVVLQ